MIKHSQYSVSSGIRLVRVHRNFVETTQLFFETFSTRASFIFLRFRWAFTPSLCIYQIKKKYLQNIEIITIIKKNNFYARSNQSNKLWKKFCFQIISVVKRPSPQVSRSHFVSKIAVDIIYWSFGICYKSISTNEKLTLQNCFVSTNAFMWFLLSITFSAGFRIAGTSEPILCRAFHG